MLLIYIIFALENLNVFMIRVINCIGEQGLFKTMRCDPSGLSP